MSNRKLSRKRKLLENDGEDDYSGGIQDEISKFGQHSSSGRQHTIDSDEEIEDDDDYNKRKHNVMDEEEIEGQEDETVEFDGETKITPFNMKDELEEGYFDGNGMYIWNKKDASEIRDSWLDSIDWVKVKPPGKVKTSSAAKPISEEDEDSQEGETVNVLDLYKEMLKLLKPGETILKALKRLGGSGSKQLSASERLKQKKQAAKLAAASGEPPPAPTKPKQDAGDKKAKPEKPETAAPVVVSDVTRLTEIADKILSATGNMDVYQETFESVSFKIKREEVKKGKSTVTGVEDDDDMFGDGFTAKKDEQLNNEPSTSSSASFGLDGGPSINDASDEIKWEFKWEDKEEAPVYGPHTSSEMNAWVSEGYFKEGVFVRKYKQDGPFYTSKRIDFDIYC